MPNPLYGHFPCFNRVKEIRSIAGRRQEGVCMCMCVEIVGATASKGLFRPIHNSDSGGIPECLITHYAVKLAHPYLSVDSVHHTGIRKCVYVYVCQSDDILTEI